MLALLVMLAAPPRPLDLVDVRLPVVGHVYVTRWLDGRLAWSTGDGHWHPSAKGGE